jgi:hypothetical protein
MNSIDDIFYQASYQWDLECLYNDLASIKGRRLTPVEKLNLRGLLCGYSPAEIAEHLNKSVKGVEVDLCNTLYQYVKNLVGKTNGKVENWRNITDWLTSAGYQKQTSVDYQVNDYLSLNLTVQKAHVVIQKNQLLIDVNIRLATPLPQQPSREEDIHDPHSQINNNNTSEN